MDWNTFAGLVMACAPSIHPTTAHALVAVESRFNPHAIGVVGGQLTRQPRTLAEARVTTAQLQADGWDFSAGLAQINRRNWKRVGLSDETAFEPCANLRAMQTILIECIKRTSADEAPQHALRLALSCYYSGNFATGFKHGYVDRVVRAARDTPPAARAPP